MKPVEKIDRRAALAFLCARLGLDGPFWSEARAGEEAEKLGMWQIDSIRVTGLRNQELAWAARSQTPPDHFYRLLYDESRLVETHYPVFATRRDWLPIISASLNDPAILSKPLSQRMKKVMTQVETRIRDQGKIGCGQFKSRRIVGGFNTIKETTRALELLFSFRRLTIAGRDKNFQRLFDLTERRLPELVGAKAPDRGTYERAIVASALEVLKLASAEQIAQRAYHHYGPWRRHGIVYWRRLTQRYLAEETEAGRLDAVEIADLPERPTYYYAASAGAAWSAPTASDSPLRIVPPLDHLLYARPRFTELVGFEFKFEAYTPKRRRQMYFAMPLFQDGAYVGMIDGKLAGKSWRVQKLAAEPGLSPDRLRLAVHRLAKLTGAARVVASPRLDKVWKTALAGKID